MQEQYTFGTRAASADYVYMHQKLGTIIQVIVVMFRNGHFLKGIYIQKHQHSIQLDSGK